MLDAFFQFHHIPVGPILFLREWGISWRPPFVRRAADHKHTLIEAMLAVYQELPVVLIGDSGQHDPELYRDVVARHGERILAVYIRNVAPRNKRRQRQIEGMIEAVVACGSDLVLAKDSVAMAEHAASSGLIPTAAVDDIRRHLTSQEHAALGAGPERKIETDGAVDPADIAEEAMGENRKIEIDNRSEPPLSRNTDRNGPT